MLCADQRLDASARGAVLRNRANRLAAARPWHQTPLEGLIGHGETEVERVWRTLDEDLIEAQASTSSTTSSMNCSSIWSTTTAHQNTHLSMLLKRRDFADRDAIPWGILGFVALVRR